MLILRGLHSPDPHPVAVTIGNFDGFHLGHQRLLTQLRAAAQARGGYIAVVIFEPHPREFFAPEAAPTRLTSLREKLEMFADFGVDRVHVCRFNRQFSQMSAADFIQALHDELAARFVLIGDDFRFGKGRGGDFAMMEKIGEEVGFEVASMHSVLHDGIRVSSTGIRMALAQGDLRTAHRYLGRPYSISGRVVRGDGLGRQLGFHTANVQMKHNRPPLSGVYVVRAHLEGSTGIAGVANLGVRPTATQANKAVLEVHLFDFAQDIYGKHLRVEFIHKLRDEKKFPDLAALQQQIAHDVAQARLWFEKNG
ncbi:Riboflavin biosynthesis protein RibF [Ferriphaselus amnicola]|uniref:Riboflavin biosynthesis protein n=1 Tax=Ferriphaselus amnicola TaxID=1188319 RepID=A0A2Z6GF21_9PROT|nr:bifunctional riboflavin kinase/FAD synthetase [Ferriphaselus amnicola]BBE52223.1 Riboflavin biosynthesis protein RibF [Ferriphaselus amnicola]